MDDGRCGRSDLIRAHGAAGYRARGSAAAKWGGRRARVVALLLALLAAPAQAGPDVLRADGTPRPIEVRVVGTPARLRLGLVAGCRYRLTVVPGTLARPTLALGRPGEAPYVTLDAGDGGKRLVHVWDAEADVEWEAAVGGFSALTGKATVRLETLGADGHPTRPHRRFLAPTGDRARVGELLLREPNRWELAVEPGTAYEITPTQGSAGRVRLRVLQADGQVLADSEQAALAWLAHPPLRFRAPAAPDGAPGAAATNPRLVLEVRGLFDGGGSYGLRLRPLAEGQSVDPPAVEAPEAVERGAIPGQPQAFLAGPGDLAVLFVPLSPDITQVVQVQRGEHWVQMEDIGRGGSARSQENALLVWFQPYYPGTYRFRPVPAPPPSEPALLLLERSALGGAPIHMGTGADPTVRARLASAWTQVALGICMPGWDYLFVCVGAPERGVAMRVRDPQGRVVRTRSASAATVSPGLGPSLRFSVSGPGVYRFEARGGRGLIVRPLLRRAAN